MIKVCYFGGIDADVYKANPATLPGLPEHEVNPDKAGASLWAPVVMDPGARRCKENVKETTAFVIDLDGATPAQVAATFANLAGVEYWAHTSHGHNPQADVHKWRFIVPFAKPAPANMHAAIWDCLATKYCPWLDQKCKDIARHYYLPSCPPDREANAISMQSPGPRLDWTGLDLAPTAKPAAKHALAGGIRELNPDEEADTIAAIASAFPPKGQRHELALALGGALRRELIQDQQIARIVEAAFAIGGSDRPGTHAATALESAAAAAAGEPTKGWTSVAAILGPDATRSARKAANILTANINPDLIGLPQQSTHDAWPDAASSSTVPLVCNMRGSPINCGANVERILSGHPAWEGVLAYDELANCIFALKPSPAREGSYVPIGRWTDAHTACTQHWILDRFGFEPAKQATNDALMAVANRVRFHPIREYLSSLRWDGESRTELFLQRYFGAVDSVYHRAVGRKFLISCVARVMRPGAKVDTMLILEGPQGKRKSTAFAVLAGDNWFSDSAIDFRSKDAVQVLQGKWIVEIAELDSFRRAQMTTIKAFISSKVDNIRPSYGRFNVDFPRQCVFVGTTNESQYLTDPTGNRRFWPVECLDVDIDSLTADRDQLWAEAVHLWRAGTQWWLDEQEAVWASAQAEEKLIHDPWEDDIVTWLKTAPDVFTCGQIMAHLNIEKAQRTSANATRVGGILRRLGCGTRKQREPGNWRRSIRVYTKDESVPVKFASVHAINGEISGVSTEVGPKEAGGGS